MKVILCGPPNSGKSCLRQGLKDAIRSIPGAPYPLFIPAAPDGDGSWYQETRRRDPALAADLRAAYRSKFTPEFVQRMADSVKNCSLPLVVFDVGGIPDEKNERICAGATHAVLLAGDPSRFQEWRDFCTKVGLQIVAEIRSDYHGATDSVRKDENGLLVGSIHHLERGEDVADRPMIQALARHLLTLLPSHADGAW